jgi:hypothetical protein
MQAFWRNITSFRKKARVLLSYLPYSQVTLMLGSGVLANMIYFLEGFFYFISNWTKRELTEIKKRYKVC